MRSPREARDGGQAAVELVAITLLVAALLAGAASLAWGPAILNAVHSGIRRALCVAGGEDCADFHRQQPCLVAADDRARSSGASVLSVRIGGSEGLLIERRSDGRHVVTVTGEQRGGVSLGIGGSIGLGRRVAGDRELAGGDDGGLRIEGSLAVEATLRGGWGDSWELPDRAAVDRFVRAYAEREIAKIPGHGDAQAAARRVPRPDLERVSIGVDGKVTGAVSGPLEGFDASGSAIAGLTGSAVRDHRTGRTMIAVGLSSALAGELTGPLKARLGGDVATSSTATLVLDRGMRPRELRIGGRRDTKGGDRRRELEVRLDVTRPELGEAVRRLLGGATGLDPATVRDAARRLGRWAVDDGWFDERELRRSTETTGTSGELALGLKFGYQDEETRSRAQLVRARTRPPGGVWETRPDCSPPTA